VKSEEGTDMELVVAALMNSNYMEDAYIIQRNFIRVGI